VVFADGVTVARDGTVYFTDAAALPPQRYPSKGNRYEVVEAVTDAILMGPTGRLLRYSPAQDQTTVLMEGLWFANGVALSYDETFVLVRAVATRARRGLLIAKQGRAFHHRCMCVGSPAHKLPLGCSRGAPLG
jgi:sugar lactone lactonase YvrE